MSTWSRSIRVLAFSVAGSLALAAAASAQVTFNVNSALDEVDDNTSDGVCHTSANTCTLRAAVMQANLITLGTRILLPAGTYRLTRLATGDNGPDSGDLNLTVPTSGNPAVDIVGAGQSFTIIDANDHTRAFEVSAGRNLYLSGLTIRNGRDSFGGAIVNRGTLGIEFCTISGNRVLVYGGGISNYGSLFIGDSKISGNSASQGGGIINYEYVSLRRTTISANLAVVDGGGIANWGTFYADESTIGLNTSRRDGGGIYSPSFAGENLTLINTTIYGNSADGSGGGIYFGSLPGFNANVFNSTIAFNSADSDADQEGGAGGGIYVEAGSGLHIRNTLVVGNILYNQPIYEDCRGSVNSYGRSLFWEFGDACTVFVQTGEVGYLNSLDGLGPLQINGGRTATVALLAGSNAIDGGDPELGCIGPGLGPLPTDQRGAARVVGARCDVGAFEFGAMPAGFFFSDGFESGNLWRWGG